MFLTPEELIELTGRRRRDAQVEQLRAMGIEHRVRADGKAVVLKAHIEKEFDGGGTTVKKVKETRPNWNAVR